METLNDLGLYHFKDRITHRLSGGEKRLVAMATLLSMKPEVLLLDEPATGLDDVTKTRLAEILSGLSVSCIVISHDPEFTRSVTNTVSRIKDGIISPLV
jgi:cobalt/nickel transport system ATP-binding protein